MASSIFKLFLSSIILCTMLQPYTEALRKVSMLCYSSTPYLTTQQPLFHNHNFTFCCQIYTYNASQFFCFILILCSRPILYTWENTLMVQLLPFVILSQPQILTIIYWFQSWEGIYRIFFHWFIQVLCIKKKLC